MDRIEIDINNGLLKVTYPTNQLRDNLVKSVGLTRDIDGKGWMGSSSLLDSLIEKIKENGLYMSLSQTCVDRTGLSEHGYSAAEIQERKGLLVNHPSAYEGELPAFYDLDLGMSESLTPFPFQKSGVCYGVQIANGRVIVADDMGLGKTIQAILIASYFRDNWPLAIIAPASLLFSWKKEFLRTLDFLDYDDIKVCESGADDPCGLITICSYNYMSDNLDKLKEYTNVRGMSIFDEAHALKNIESKRGMSGVELAHHTSKVIMVTGTPMLNRPIEMFPLLHAVNPIVFDSKRQFAIDYCEGHMQTFGPTKRIFYESGARNLDKLQMLARSKYMYRRRKTQVLTQLPKKSRFPLTLKPSRYDANIDTFAETVRGLAIPILATNQFDINKSLPILRKKFSTKQNIQVFEEYRRSGLLKLNSCIDYVRDCLESSPDEPVLIFAHHNDVLNGMEDLILKEYGEGSYIRIDGKMHNKRKRFELAERFQSDKSIKVALLSIGAAATGLTFTRAKKTIMLEMPWSPRIALQAEDRIFRIGQGSDVCIVYLLGWNGFDDLLWSMLVGKNEASNEALDGEDGDIFDGDYDEEDLFESDDLLSSLLSQFVVQINSGEILVSDYV